MVEKKSIKHHYLNMEDITDADYAYAGRVFKDFEIKNLVEYHDLYVQIDILLLADFLSTLEICVLNYTNLILQNFLSAPGLAWKTASKKVIIELMF